MKKVLFLFTVLLIFVNSCKNRCKNLDCGHGGCQNGECFCEDGWMKNENGLCVKVNPCYLKDCGTHGNCTSQGDCNCEEGWLKDTLGKCTIWALCYQKDCGNFGICDSISGGCLCNDGYETDTSNRCNIVGRSNITGVWRTVGVQPYSMIVSPSLGNIKVVEIVNFLNLGCNGGATDVTAIVVKGSDGHYRAANQFQVFPSGCIMATLEVDTIATNINVTEKQGTGINQTMTLKYKIKYNGINMSGTEIFFRQ